MQADNRSRHLYTPLFCEENIWQLARQLLADGVNSEALQVVFISNVQQQVMLFNQSKDAKQGYVVWDYHVVLREFNEDIDHIYDFDTLLPFPCDSRDYLNATFGVQSELPEALQSSLRLISATDYLQNFYSDRSHMQDVIAEDKFPAWTAITPEHDRVIRLDEYWDMQRKLIDGSRILSVDVYIATEL